MQATNENAAVRVDTKTNSGPEEAFRTLERITDEAHLMIDTMMSKLNPVIDDSRPTPGPQVVQDGGGGSALVREIHRACGRNEQIVSRLRGLIDSVDL